jgi:hypothetical protein
MREGISLREGDIYKWYYKNDAEYRRNNSSTAYWCMDNRCIVRNGELVDTYWDGVELTRLSSNSSYLNPDKVDLEFICNVGDVEFIKKYEIEDYDKVYNLSYQKGCYPCFAIDKGAQVSNKALCTKYQGLLDKAHSDKRSAEYNIEYYSKLIEDLGK